ncbi:MAG: hypothetical protein JST30_15010 [Armatimonadetes bacterium]|nr:hypothetical protein [Armatimonadota bacterium]
MRYFVLWPDGQRFGPADAQTLTQWAWEGRITPETELEEEATGRRFSAALLTGLEFPPPPEPTPVQTQVDSPHTGFGVPQEFPLTSGSPYPIATSQGKPKSDVNTAWGLIIGGFVSSVCAFCCIFPLPLALTGAGIYYANRAKKADEPGAQTALTVGIVAIVLQTLVIGALYAVRFFAATSAFRTGGFP